MNGKFNAGRALLQPFTSRLSERQMILAILFVSLVMRLLATWRVGIIGSDGLVYSRIATEILEGRWLQSNRTLLFNPFSAAVAFLHAWTGISIELSGELLNTFLGGLGVLPLYWWGRDAFGRRIAVASAWIFAVHPMLIRFSAPMMRDGMYWFFMLWAIQLFWSALQRGGAGRFLLSGVCAAGATLVRTEGFGLYMLFLMWCFCLPRFPRESRFSFLFRTCGTITSGMVFPVVLLLLNLLLLPPGEPFSGLERIGFLSPTASSWVAGLRTVIPRRVSLLIATSSKIPPESTGEIKLVSSESLASTATVLTPSTAPPLAPAAPAPAPVATPTVIVPPSPRTLQQVVDLIPAWNDRGDNMDPEGYTLRQFLMLAEENRSILYGVLFTHQLIHGFRVPVLICFVVGLGFGFRRMRLGRDLPLFVYASLLSSFMWLHLTKTNVLEARYLMSLMPVIFPWAGWGLHVSLVLCRERWRKTPWERWLSPRPVLVFSLIVSGGTVFWALRLTRDESFQRHVADIIRRETPAAGSLAGHESFARSGYYAAMPYTKLPPHPEQAWTLIATFRPSFVLLRAQQSSYEDSLEEKLDRDSRFERMKLSNPRFDQYRVYRYRQGRIAQNVTGLE